MGQEEEVSLGRLFYSPVGISTLFPQAGPRPLPFVEHAQGRLPSRVSDASPGLTDNPRTC